MAINPSQKTVDLQRILKNRLALSSVVSTLIVLVISVLLAGVVVYYGINVTSTRVQEENLSLTKLHVWCSDAGASQAAFLIINTGGRDVVINKITIRGQAAEWTDVYSGKTSTAITDDFSYISGSLATSVSGVSLTVNSGYITLKSGDSMIVYISNPDSITTHDIGLTVSITVFTSQAMYYQEANVQTP